MANKTTLRRKPSRPSSITQLDPKIKEAVDTAVREGRSSIDEIVALINAQGGEASRSAVGRYVKTANQKLEEYRQAQQMAAVWVEKIGKEPEGDVGRLLVEMLRTLAFRSISETESVSPEDLMFLSNAIKGFAQTDKITVDKELAIRKLIAAKAEKAANEIVKEARKIGASEEMIQTWRQKVLGVTAK